MRAFGRFLWRTFVGLLVLVILTGIGILAALGLVSTKEVRIYMHEPRNLPLPDPSVILFGSTEVDAKEIIPLDQMGRMKGPNRFKRQSWENVDHASRPTDPRADPLQGGTRLMYYEPGMELELATALHRANLPNRILRVGIGESPPKRHSTLHRSLGVESVRRICEIEVYAGNPISRSGVEETADRAIEIAFDVCKQVDEVDVEAVPWRTYPGHKPPTWFSVSALRAAYLPIAGVRSHGDNLRSCGAVWSDDRVMSDVPVH